MRADSLPGPQSRDPSLTTTLLSTLQILSSDINPIPPRRSPSMVEVLTFYTKEEREEMERLREAQRRDNASRRAAYESRTTLSELPAYVVLY